MKLDDLFDERSFASVLEDRRVQYFCRAEAFLRRAFTPATRHLGQSDLRLLVEDCFSEAARFGVASERDHLRYLTARMFMGRNFLLNPLHQRSVQEAELLLSSGKLCLASDGMRFVMAWVDARSLLHAQDLYSVARLIRHLQSIYDGDPNRISAQDIHHHIVTMWPATLDGIDETTFRSFAKPIHDDVILAGGRVSDAVAAIALGVHFGHSLLTDPALPWLNAALRAKEVPLADRRAMALEGLDLQLAALQTEE